LKLHLTNLDELLQQVRNIHAKNYINESIASYRTGAYRASLITTWIAVCVDIIEKIKELSLNGDLAAKRIEERLNNIKPSEPNEMISFERDILKIACEQLQLISTIEKTHLERLKEDRNICAHPTFSDDGSQFTPPAELALAYIIQASNHLLIHQPVKGKVIIERVFQLINEPSFPEEDEKAYLLLSSENNLGRVRDSGVRNLIIIIFKRLFLDDARISQGLLNRLSASLGAIARLYPEINKEATSNKLGPMLSGTNDEKFKRLFPLLRLRPELWSKIDKPERIRIEGLIQSMAHNEITKYQLTKISEANQTIRGIVLKQICKYEKIEQIDILSAYPCLFLKDMIIDLFSKAESFNSAELIGNKLILPLCEKFTDSDMRSIFTGSLNNTSHNKINQILNAGGIGIVFSSLYTQTKSAQLSHQTLWTDFWHEITQRGFHYDSLYDLLVEDIYIQQEESESNDENDDLLPF
jgi:hypothetical protein